jgi:NAD(P)H-dependent FMN reductase
MMDRPLRVLGVSGSLRQQSKTAVALRLFLDFVAHPEASHGAEARMLDLRSVELPMYRPDRETPSEAQKDITDQVEWADAFVLATPDYHGSMSGAMKNFLDYHWEELAGKVFGYICSSHEKGLTVMDQMRTVVRQCYGWSIPYGVAFDGRADFDATGKLHNARVEQRLKMMARDLVVYGALIRGQFLEDLAGEHADTFAATYRG